MDNITLSKYVFLMELSNISLIRTDIPNLFIK